jgi:hypothetical protein
VAQFGFLFNPSQLSLLLIEGHKASLGTKVSLDPAATLSVITSPYLMNSKNQQRPNAAFRQ